MAMAVVNIANAQETSAWNSTSIKDTVKVTATPRTRVYEFNAVKQGMIPVAGKQFDKNSAWYTNSYQMKSDKEAYYKVSKNEFLKALDLACSNLFRQ